MRIRGALAVVDGFGRGVSRTILARLQPRGGSVAAACSYGDEAGDTVPALQPAATREPCLGSWRRGSGRTRGRDEDGGTRMPSPAPVARGERSYCYLGTTTSIRTWLGYARSTRAPGDRLPRRRTWTPAGAPTTRHLPIRSGLWSRIATACSYRCRQSARRAWPMLGFSLGMPLGTGGPVDQWTSGPVVDAAGSDIVPYRGPPWVCASAPPCMYIYVHTHLWGCTCHDR